jgi:FkbM family methyltransferase
MAHEIFPKATIHCFEIMHSTFQQLQRNTLGIPNIIVNDCGLLDKEGEVPLRYFPEHDTLTTLTDFPHQMKHVPAVGSVIAGDSYLIKKGIDHVDFIKIDTEGSDHLVLVGFSEAIEHGKVEVIQFEYGQAGILTKFLLRDFYLFLSSKGYRVGKMYPDYVEFRDYKMEHEDFYGSNYLAVLEKRRDLIDLLAAP